MAVIGPGDPAVMTVEAATNPSPEPVAFDLPYRGCSDAFAAAKTSNGIAGRNRLNSGRFLALVAPSRSDIEIGGEGRSLLNEREAGFGLVSHQPLH